MAKVLALPELVCEILNHLPFHDFFTSSRACGGFKDTIRDTKRLREKLKCQKYTWTNLQLLKLPGRPYLEHVPILDRNGGQVADNWLLCPLLSWDQPQPGTAVDGAPGRYPIPQVRLDLGKYLADPKTWRPVYLTNPPRSSASQLVALGLSIEFLPGRITVTSSLSNLDVKYAGRVTLGQLMNRAMGSVDVHILHGDSFDSLVRRKDSPMYCDQKFTDCVRWKRKRA